jgi:hypothetical protein
MGMSIDEFWRTTPRFLFGLIREYEKQRRRAEKSAGKSQRSIVRLDYIDDLPGR